MTTSNKEKTLQLAEKCRICYDEEFTKPKVAIEQKNIKSDGYTTIGTLGNFSVLIGKAKSRKSFLVGALISAVASDELILDRHKGKLPEKQRNVIYFDTEQGKYHVQQALKRICKQINVDKSKNLDVYHLRALSPSERLELIEAVIYEKANLGFVVIDGIRDLITSINNEEQASEIATKLLKWSEELNIHIVVVLHQNKGNTNARGHLGTELVNKAEVVLSVTKQTGNQEISIVKPEYSRGLQPEPFAFKIIDGLPSAVDNVSKNIGEVIGKGKIGTLTDEEKKKLLKDVFSEEKGFMYSELVKQIKSSYNKLYEENVGDNQVKSFITECKDKKWILQETPRRKHILSSSL